VSSTGLTKPATSAFGAVALAAAFAAPVITPAPAAAYTSASVAQPGYESSTLAMTVKGRPRAGRLVTLRVSGSNALFPVAPDPDFPDREPLDYTLDVYVQDRSVFPSCGETVDDQTDRVINLPDKVQQIGFILEVGPAGPFKRTITFRSGSARKLTFCAYIRYSATDDIIRSSLKHDMRGKRRPR
jgi:hypothetical protein